MELPATEFKAKCLAYLDQVQRTRAEIVLTKHGRPVAKLVPVEEGAQEVFGRLAGTVQIHGDIVHPLDEIWEADA